MKKTIIALASCALTLSIAAPVFAQVNIVGTAAATNIVSNGSISASIQVHTGKRMGTTTTRMGLSTTTREADIASREVAMKGRSDTEISQRITDLNQLAARINAMIKVSAEDKSSLSAMIQTEIADLTTLKGQIDTDTGTTTLRADMQSITQAYRIYVLVIPQGQIAAASDRIDTIAANFTTIGTKLQVRISTLPAGTDTSAMVSTLADFTAKIADANTQAQAAVTETATLQPDNGNTTIAASNEAALKDARTKIETAQKDLQAAQKDAETLIKAIEAFKVPVSATTTLSTTIIASSTTQ